MKSWIPTLFLVLLAFSATSCLKTGEDEIASYYDVMATLTTVDNYPAFETDGGTTLKSINKVTIDSASLKIGNRFYVRYEFGDTIGHALNNYPIAVAKLWKVDTKDFVAIEKDSTDHYYNQALQSVYRIDISGNYFNMIFNTFAQTGLTDAYELVRIKEVENNSPQDTLPTIFFELRHNVYTANYSIFSTRFASFKLNPLLTEFPLAKEFKLNLKWLTYSNSYQNNYVFSFVPVTNSSASSIPMKRTPESIKNLPFTKSSFSSGL